MNKLRIAENIIRLRHDRKITQEELADFIGVTKASVSKWESGRTMPDVLLLPQLAAFFDVTLDDLFGYEAQLSQEQIRRLYEDLCEGFVRLPFEEALEEARSYAHCYYSCYPFLLQLGVLYLNHAMLAQTQEEQKRILQEADSFCTHILDRCTDASICEDAASLKATLYLQLGRVKDAADLLEGLADPGRLSEQNDLLLIHAYYQGGEIERAKSYTQIRIYMHLLSMLSAQALLLSLYESELERCEEIIRRIKGIMELYHLEKLHPNLAAQLYYQTAIVYGRNGKKEEAVAELTGFERCVCFLLRDKQILLHGDAYFDRLDEWIERLPLGDAPPRKRQFARQSALQALSHPAFADLQEAEEFQRIYRHISQGGKENA
ncbi:MAG: helix-turn-helix transcriptional regulator [Eubacteriales bacterium]|nr:helix-turn-helix transcriptional regulator [Eubacteriales bacterium]